MGDSVFPGASAIWIAAFSFQGDEGSAKEEGLIGHKSPIILLLIIVTVYIQ